MMRLFLILSAVLLLSACPRPYAAWLEAGGAEGLATFGVGARHGDRGGIDVGYFAVATCEDHDVAIQKPGMLAASRLETLPWAIVRAVDVGAIQRVEYGTIPVGYRELSRGAANLVPGCYVAEIHGAHGGAAYVRFALDSARRARELR